MGVGALSTSQKRLPEVLLFQGSWLPDEGRGMCGGASNEVGNPAQVSYLITGGRESCRGVLTIAAQM